MPGGEVVISRGFVACCNKGRGIACYRPWTRGLAHAVAKHSAEPRIEQADKEPYGAILGQVPNAAGVSSGTTQLAQVMAQKRSCGFRSLKYYARDNESEADRMGLIFAAMAGYGSIMWLLHLAAYLLR